MVPKPKFKTTKLITLLVLGVAFFGASVAAENARELSQEYSACLDKAKGVTVDMMDCIAAETRRQDTRLNENYKTLSSKVSPRRKRALLDAQRAWVRFRDANCDFYADPEGGTSARLSASECLLNATADRAKELKLLIPE